MTEREITHRELCRLTAERFLRESDISIWEYQSFASGEFPDVLCFKNSHSTLYEIKVSRPDFLADAKKDSRKKWKPKIGYYLSRDNNIAMALKARAPELYYIEAPHLGVERYYVCPSGMIEKNEVPESWVLYWYKNGRFFKKKSSGQFRRDLFAENSILCHALRKMGNGIEDERVLVNQYKNIGVKK